MTYQNMSPFDIHTDHENLSETEFLKNSIANHTKYGSTNCNLNSQNYRFITHYIEQTDTLQGLALKYGCQIENIKKFNKLFSDDNNHLRSRFSILVPIEAKTKIQFDANLSTAEPLTNNNGGINSLTKTNHAVKNAKRDARICHSFEIVNNGDTTQDRNFSNKSISFNDSNHLKKYVENESVADFLIRIDSSIAKTKNKVETLTKRTERDSIEDELNKINTKKFNTPKLSSEKISFKPTSSNNIFDQESVRVNRNKKIKSSLKKLEKSQEEIFEL